MQTRFILRPVLSLLVALACAGSLPPARAQDDPAAACRAPASPVDRLVCGDDRLLQAHVLLQARAQAFAKGLNGLARQHFLDDEARWMQSRQAACAAGLTEAAECLVLLYEDRIALVDDLAHCARYPFVSQQTLIETGNRNRLHVYAAYPRFDSNAANFTPFNNGVAEVATRVAATLRQAVAAAPDKQDLYGYQQTYRLHCISDVAIGLEFANYAYGGLAHPVSGTAGYLIDRRTGGILVPNQLFAAGSHWRERVSDIVARDLKRQLDARGESDAMPSAADIGRLMGEDRRFLFRRGKLVIAFDSGEVGPYADGPRTVEIPYPVLRSLLAAGAPLAD